MKQTVKVMIEKTPNGYQVSNDRGMKWNWLVKGTHIDQTAASGLASIATSCLMATLSTQCKVADEEGLDIVFSLSFETFKRY